MNHADQLYVEKESNKTTYSPAKLKQATRCCSWILLYMEMTKMIPLPVVGAQAHPEPVEKEATLNYERIEDGLIPQQCVPQGVPPWT